MKPAPFVYEAPSTLDEAVGRLAQYGDDAKVLAGGQSLVPLMALRLARFEAVIDLNRVDGLDFVRDHGDRVVVGAMTRQSTVEASPVVRRAVPVLAEATRLIGHFQIRNRGTIGGSIAHGDPAAEYPAVALALDAVITATGPDGPREIAAADLYDGPMTTVLADEEILSSIAFPVWGPGSRFAVREAARREGDFATAGVVAGVTVTDGRVGRATLAFFGMAPTPVRSQSAEAALVGSDAGRLDLAAIGEAAVGELHPASDVHASATYRRRVAARLATHALQSVLQEVTP